MLQSRDSIRLPRVPGVSQSEEVYFESLQQVFPLRNLTSKVLRYLQWYNSSYTTIHAFGRVVRQFLSYVSLFYSSLSTTIIDETIVSLLPFNIIDPSFFLVLLSLYICTRNNLYCYFTRSLCGRTREYFRTCVTLFRFLHLLRHHFMYVVVYVCVCRDVSAVWTVSSAIYQLEVREQWEKFEIQCRVINLSSFLPLSSFFCDHCNSTERKERFFFSFQYVGRF